MKILQIIDQGAIRSGGAMQMSLLAKELVKRGHDVTVVFRKTEDKIDDFKIFDNSGVKVRFFNTKRLKLKKETVKNILDLREFIKKEKFDIIHSHKGGDLNYLMFALIGTKIPVIGNRGMSNRLDFFNGFKYRTKRVFKTVAVAKEVKRIMMESGKIPDNKIDVIYGSVNIDDFRPGRESSIREEFSIDRDKTVIGYVGSALPRKGIQYLLKAFEELCEKRENLILLLVGITKETLGNFEISERIKDKVVAAGFRRDVANCMGGFDIFVFSGVEDEGLTGTVREAGAMGLPIVTTDVAGNKELISNMETGILVNKADSEDMGKGIELLLENNELREKLGKNVREFVVENMSMKVKADKIEVLYKEALESFK